MFLRPRTRPLRALAAALGLASVLTLPAAAAPFTYVVNANDYSLSVVDRGQVLSKLVPLSGAPNGVAVNPAGTRVYVTLFSGHVAVIDTATHAVTATLAVGDSPWGVAVHPDGGSVYAAAHDRLNVIDARTLALRQVSFSGWPVSMAINPAGTRLYVGLDNGSVLEFDLTADPPLLRRTLASGRYPYAMTISPDGARLYLATFGPVALVDLGSGTTRDVGGCGSASVALDGTGTRLFTVGTCAKTLSVLDTTQYAHPSVGSADLSALPGAPIGVVTTRTTNQIHVADATRLGLVTLSGGSYGLRSLTTIGNGSWYRGMATGPNPVGDWSGDGAPDLLWRDYGALGINFFWKLWGNGVLGSQQLQFSLGDPAWRIEGTGDFNQDGWPDILWRHALYGTNVLWYMKGASYLGGLTLRAEPDTAWRVGGVTDFDGDGRPDILWRHAQSGANRVWRVDVGRGGYVGELGLSSVSDTGWEFAGAGDFDRDGRADVLWRNPGTGVNGIWALQAPASGQLIPRAWMPLDSQGDASWRLQAVADFNGDGNLDVAWRRSSGENTLWYLSPNGTSLLRIGTATLPGLADANKQIVGPR